MTSKTAGERNRDHKVATQLTNGGRDPFAHHGYVNTPVYHASTLLYSSAEDFLAHSGRYSYGRRGTPTSEALETALADLEGPQCQAVTLLPSIQGVQMPKRSKEAPIPFAVAANSSTQLLPSKVTVIDPRPFAPVGS